MKISKLLNKVVAAVLLAAMVVTVAPVTSIPASAKLEDNVPKAVRIYPGSVSNYAIEGTLSNMNYTIGGLKSSSANLKVYNTYNYHYTSSSKEYSSREFDIGCYALKEGKYTVTFNVMNKKKKVKSYKVTVYAKTDSAIKSVTYAGKNLDTYPHASTRTDWAKKGKLTVKMNAGYKLKKIELRSHKKSQYSTDDYLSSETSIKTVKSGQTIELSDYTEKYKNSYESDYESQYMNYQYYDNMCSENDIYIYYIDKYSKQERIYSYSLHRLVNYEK